MLDLIIIGGGPAAISAAIYAARKKINFKILAQKVGGEQMVYTNDIENYPGTVLATGSELIQRFRDHLAKYDVDIDEGEEVIDLAGRNEHFLIKTKSGKEYSAKAVIIASGKKPRRLGVPGEKGFEGKGVVYCSICEAPMFKGKDVAVIGGGNSGLESALDLAKYAAKIYLLEFGSRLAGDPILQERLKKTGKVEFIFNAAAKEIKGQRFVKELIYQDRNSGKIKEFKVEGVFIHAGSVPSVDFARNFLKLNDADEIVIDHLNNQTSVQGIFAAGDVTDIKWKQIVIAAGEGTKALLSAYQYLSRQVGQ